MQDATGLESCATAGVGTMESCPTDGMVPHGIADDCRSRQGKCWWSVVFRAGSGSDPVEGEESRVRDFGHH